jgi:uncharacterized protein (TIGR02466 family)
MQVIETAKPVVSAFATPVFRHRWPDAETTPINAALKAEILARQAREPSAELSNIGGWQSSPDLFKWKVPGLQQLQRWISQAYGAAMCQQLGTKRFTSQFAAIGWANVNESGHYNRTHIHPNAHWAGVYYVDTGQPDSSLMPNGAIELLDPRPAVGIYELPGVTTSGTWTLQPEPGMMLLFPNWLRHSVLPYRGQGPRITISFNLRVGELSFDEEAARN